MSAGKDIKVQIPVEQSIAFELARVKGALIGPNKPGKDSKKDFTLWVPCLIEVKCDYASQQTRNAFFEVWNCYRNEPSGLTATKANWWAFYTPGDGGFYVFNPKIMLPWLEKESGITKLTGCGDKNSDGYPVPLAVLSKLHFVKWYQFIA